MERDAVFSRCKKYRYKLMRSWHEEKPSIAFIMLNPSTADHKKDDPTISRCIRYAMDWGFGRLDILNLFAYRTPYPEQLFRYADPVGARNLYYLKEALQEHSKVLCAWGNLGQKMGMEEKFYRLAATKKLYCLKQNKSLSPSHPLYMPKNLKPRLLRIKTKT